MSAMVAINRRVVRQRSLAVTGITKLEIPAFGG